MIFKQISSGGDRNFAYLIASGETGEGALIDPSPDVERVMDIVGEEIEIKYVINTHSHFDHSGGNSYFNGDGQNRTVTFINGVGAAGLEDGKTLLLGGLRLEIILTPGHTPDSICIKVE